MPAEWLKSLGQRAATVSLLRPVYDSGIDRINDPIVFSSYPQDLWGGDQVAGRWMMNGYASLSGMRMQLDKRSWFFRAHQVQTPFYNYIHSFAFLRDLKAVGGHDARRFARDMTTEWMQHFQSYHAVGWGDDMVVERLLNWIVCYSFCYETASEEFLQDLHRTMHRHHSFLIRTLTRKKHLMQGTKIRILAALITSACHTQSFCDTLHYDSWIIMLKGALEDWQEQDNHGLVASLSIGKILVRLITSLQQTQHNTPEWLQRHMHDMTHMLYSITHNDKDLPLFQGMTLPNGQALEKMKTVAKIRLRKGEAQYKKQGVTAVRRGKTSLTVHHAEHNDSHAPFAMEMAYGGYRIVTGCGTYKMDENWREPLMSIAAHSAAAIPGHEPAMDHADIKISLETMNGAGLFNGTHAGYKNEFRLTHTRRVYLDQGGVDCRGEDMFIRTIALKPQDVVIRFHLHPTVKASLVHDKGHILMRLPNGTGWIFQADNAVLSLQESVFCSDGINLQKTQQIVLNAAIEELSHTVKWAFKKV